ncbi:MAG: hypothetical protein GF405_02350 [Candidatus Eisenbacteria bacterium]|nr:hypothetical protein [Candidatus Eisenbacteria bacterium]
MQRVLMTLTLAFVLFAAGAVSGGAGGASSLVDDALAAIALDESDLSFRTDYAEHPDSFRLTVVDSLLTHPLATEPFVVAAADAALAAMTLEGLVSSCAHDLDLPLAESGCPPPVRDQMEPKSLGPSTVDVLLPALAEVDAMVRGALSALTDEERAFLRDHAPVLLEEEEFDPDKPIDVREEEEARDEELGDRLLDIAGRVDYEELVDAGRLLAAAADAAVPQAVDAAERPNTPRALPDDAPAHGDVVRVMDTESGTIVIGGPGPTTYERPCAVVIDLGGDDVYELDGDGTQTAQVIIDVAGDDVYEGGDHALGAGFLGVSVLVDLAGDDSYTARSFSIGSGLFGVGVLHDLDGNDRYVGDTCVQGAGAFGIGILRDDAGNDVYESALFSQAFGFVMGSGLLLDREGNDLYVAGLKYTDEIRYFDHYLSLSQGFGFGWRPDASGGIGIMVDGAGNDVYSSDIFGQGSSYWFAVGGLVDYAGNDQYVSYQYAQGAATHITVAALVDVEGDDNYVSKGVSQGCGHDLAVGILHDLAGDDNYTCHDLSQAAGNANGIGVLLDDSGDDVYSVRNPDNTHGYGNRRREYGSVGLFIDAGGDDVYSGHGADGTWWTRSFHGVGVDARGEEDDR